MDSFDVCSSSRPNVYLLAGAVKPLFLLLATHLLAGEGDTTLAGSPSPAPPRSSSSAGRSIFSREAEAPPPPIHARVFWLLRYYNPVNLSWRYYSILAWRASHCNCNRHWGRRHIAIVNHEAHPWDPPMPYVLTDSALAPPNYRVKRLEMATHSFMSPQGVLTLSSASQLGLAALVMSGFAGGRVQLLVLPNLGLPLFVLSLGSRLAAFPWIASKVYVDPYPYPTTSVDDHHRRRPAEPDSGRGMRNHCLACAWALLLLGFVAFSVWPWPTPTDPDTDAPTPMGPGSPPRLLTTAVQILYRYASLSHLTFHLVLLTRGAMGWANRIAFFDHWTYKAQTLVWVALFVTTLLLALRDLVNRDFYRSCVSV